MGPNGFELHGQWLRSWGADCGKEFGMLLHWGLMRIGTVVVVWAEVLVGMVLAGVGYLWEAWAVRGDGLMVQRMPSAL